jgi:hypothetical protein
MAATLALAGRLEEAARHLDRAEALEPGWPHLEATRFYTFERADDLEHLRAGIRPRRRRRRRCRRDADLRRSGEGGPGLVDDGAEGGGLVDGEVGEVLALDPRCRPGSGRRPRGRLSRSRPPPAHDRCGREGGGLLLK